MFTIQDAERELTEAEKLNPGRWIDHSKATALNAKLIAEKVEGMDSGKAYCMGLLHDIGRRVGVVAVRHIFEGYYYMNKIGQPEIARICLTHSFPGKGSDTYFGTYDCTEEEKKFLDEYIAKIEYDDYDRLIQLCDAISLPTGACIMEKRLIDVALRYGVPKFSPDKWRASMENKRYFDALCGCNIYTLLPNVMENSYENLPI